MWDFSWFAAGCLRIEEDVELGSGAVLLLSLALFGSRIKRWAGRGNTPKESWRFAQLALPWHHVACTCTLNLDEPLSFLEQGGFRTTGKQASYAPVKYNFYRCTWHFSLVCDMLGDIVCDAAQYHAHFYWVALQFIWTAHSHLLATGVVNPRRACAVRVVVLGLSFRPSVCLSVCQSVCLSVCLSVITFSATMRNKAAKKRYQQVQCYTGLIFKMVFPHYIQKLWHENQASKPIC